MSRFLTLAALVLATPAVAAPVPKETLTKEQEAEFNRLWDDAGNMVGGVRLYCRLATQPQAAEEYLRRHLRPAALEESEAKKLLTALDSDDDVTWKRAFRALGVRDIRLALPLDEAWAEIKTDRQKARLGELSHHSGRSPDKLPVDREYQLVGPAEGKRDWWMRVTEKEKPCYTVVVDLNYPDVAKMLERDHEYRLTAATAALVRIGTDTARAQLTGLTDGHPDAPATTFAGRALDEWKRDKPKERKPSDLWRLSLADLSRPVTLNQFLDRPVDTVTLFKKELKPLTLSRDTAEKLLAQLFGEDAKEVRVALRELSYFDLRLAMTVEDAWKLATTPTARGRLVSTFDWDLPELDGDQFDLDGPHRVCDFTLQPPDRKDGPWTMRPEKREGVADVDWLKVPGVCGVSVWSDMEYANNARWLRAEMALSILDVIGTDEAIGIIKDMATGHPDAGPTKAAKAVLTRRGVK